jgi:uncharacterized protein YegP (UPF0339 family)
MDKHYDFSKGRRGIFYQGGKPFRVTIEGLENPQNPRYEVFRIENGKYRFRLRNDKTILLESTQEFTSEDECKEAILFIKQESIVAPTVFA